MRRIIIDTDTGSDDAVALIMGLKSKDIKIEAITTVGGNVSMEQATRNALMTIEVTDAQYPPVYKGATKPLMRDLVTTTSIHGEDGMGDCGLIHPTLSAEKGRAVDKIISLVKEYPNEIEIVTLGPVTNIALAILTEPETMKKVKMVYSMGTAGFGQGNITPVAEFNVYVDAEAYKIMLNSGINITIIGLDLCTSEVAIDQKDMALLLNSHRPEARFAVICNKSLMEYNIKSLGESYVCLPDAVAMGVVLWKDIVLDALKCRCYVCTIEEPAYGQVIIYTDVIPTNATLITKINQKLYKKRLIDLLRK